MDKKYYIYVYYREDKTTPYYIGKGCEGRITGHHSVKVPDKEYREKLYENLWEDDAYIIESELINKYGRKGIDYGGILDNIASGRYSMEEIAEEYKERERIRIEEEKDKEYFKRLDEEWQWELDKLIWIKDNSPSMWNEIYNTYWEYKIESALTSCDKEYEESIEYETADALVNGHTTVESYNESLV